MACEPLTTRECVAATARCAGSDTAAAPPFQVAHGRQRVFQNSFNVAFLLDFSAADASDSSVFAKTFLRISGDTASYLPALFFL